MIGAGIAGLGAAWLLSRSSQVTLYEREARPGGHANTVTVPAEDGHEPVAVDTGFIVYNDVTYPNLIRLFELIGVETAASEMSFSVSIDDGRLEYAGNTLASLFAQKTNLLRPSFYRMVRDILRFYREAPALLTDPAAADVTIGDYLRQRGYGPAFARDHLLPMAAAIWSAPLGEVMGFPAQSFVRFCENHGLIRLSNRPQWRTLAGGSRTYVDRLIAAIAGDLKLGSPAVAIVRDEAGVTVRDAAGGSERFDQVLIACHADQALALLTDADDMERRVLGPFRFQPNRAVLHRDVALMPRRKAAWSSWNYLSRGGADPAERVSVSYWMNRLQPIDPRRPLFVTLNPLSPPREDLVIAEFSYDHPILDAAAIAAQPLVGTLQGRRRTWFAGAWTGYGFHEDGLSSGLAAAEDLGGLQRPWVAEEVSPAGRHTRAAVSGSRG
ncbi:MAG: FAD-dependent oxidoreductase [Rhodospirillaceae bacterium]